MKLNEIFSVEYGNKFDLNKMIEVEEFEKGCVNFVSRSSRNLGISAIVKEIDGVTPYAPGGITVSLGGTYLLSSFVQLYPFYTAQNVAVLYPKKEMTFNEKLYYALCIRGNRYRYSAFGREANRTLRTLEVPSKCPDWVKKIPFPMKEGMPSHDYWVEFVKQHAFKNENP